jgi:hypothetical protein
MKHFFVADPIKLGIFNQVLLRSNIGTFVGEAGRLYYRCLIANVHPSRRMVDGMWLGLPARRDLNNWRAMQQISSYNMQLFVDYKMPLEVVPWTARIHGHDYSLFLPADAKRGDEVVVCEYHAFPPPSWIPHLEVPLR